MNRSRVFLKPASFSITDSSSQKWEFQLPLNVSSAFHPLGSEESKESKWVWEALPSFSPEESMKVCQKRGSETLPHCYQMESFLVVPADNFTIWLLKGVCSEEVDSSRMALQSHFKLHIKGDGSVTSVSPLSPPRLLALMGKQQHHNRRLRLHVQDKW